MVFSTPVFMFGFLVLTLLVYYAMPLKWRNAVLLCSSLFFYYWGEQKYTIIMVLSTLIDFSHGWLVDYFKKKNLDRHAKIAVASSVIFNLSILFVFKYWDFVADSLRKIGGINLPMLGVALPIGISFYTFQTMSYTIDVYRGDAQKQKNIVHFGAFVTLFPQLIAGPIVRYSTVAEQVHTRKSTWEGIENGITRFVVGLSKKVLIANELGRLCELYKGTADTSVLYTWIYAVAFMLHIYFDFSGYSDMAIGLGRILGFTFPENFNYPYISGSITEFWRRWHMSLGTWFRDYLYIPLGGNRVCSIKWYRNILLVWLFTGFWHGASWNFVVWGMFFGLLLVIEKKWLIPILRKAKVFNHIYVLILLMISFVIFNGENLGEAFLHIRNMLGFGGIPFYSKEAGYYLGSFGVLIMAAIIGSTPAIRLVCKKIQDHYPKFSAILKTMGLVFLFVLATAYLIDGSFNPFLYFRF